MTRVDLHLHSTASDGVLPPETVVRHAARVGLRVIALTDHDTVAGVPAALAEGQRHGVRVIAGCEFSVAAAWGEIHLLAYFLPAAAPALESFLADQREKRLARAHKIVERLEQSGVALSLDDVLAESRGAAVGRPHVARALVRRGCVEDLAAAFARYLGKGKPAFVAKQLPRVSEVTGLARRLGAVTAAAHLKELATRGNLARLRAEGVDGVEVRHPAHGDELARTIEALAAELDLLPTGGSDWHGDEDPRGERGGLGSVTIPDAWLGRLDSFAASRQGSAEVAWEAS